MAKRASGGGCLVACILTALAGGAITYEFLSSRSYDAAIEAGVKTVAQVTRTEPSDDCHVVEKNHACLRLTLEVHPPGRPAYAATLTHDIAFEWSSRVQPGSWLTVAVDPKDRSRVYFDHRAMTTLPPAPPSASETR